MSEDTDYFELYDHSYKMSLTCFRLRDGDSKSDSHTCLVDMKIVEEEDETETEKINFEEIKENLRRRRQIKVALIFLIFLLSLGLIIYSVLVDINQQKSK